MYNKKLLFQLSHNLERFDFKGQMLWVFTASDSLNVPLQDLWVVFFSGHVV